jgi:hypothetical protein
MEPAISGPEGGDLRMDAALVFTYSRPIPGREAKALSSFMEALSFFGKLATDGRCGEPMIFSGQSGKGMFVVPGDRDRLNEILQGDDFMWIYLKTTFTTPDIGYELFMFGDAVTEMYTAWSKAGAELAYM